MTVGVSRPRAALLNEKYKRKVKNTGKTLKI